MTDSLAASLEALTKTACRALVGVDPSDHLRSHRAFAVEGSQIVEQEASSWGSAYRVVHRLLQSPAILPKVIEASLQAQACMGRDETSVQALNAGQTFNSSAIVHMFLSDYFESMRAFAFSKVHFDNRYTEMLRFLDPGARMTILLAAPLVGFYPEQASLKLDNTIRIRHLAKEELAELLTRSASLRLHHLPHITPSTVLEAKLDVNKVTPPDDNDVISTADQLFDFAALVNREILLMRCFARTTATAQAFALLYDGWPADFFAAEMVTELPWQEGAFWYGGDPISRHEVRTYKALRKRFLDSHQDHPALQAAARRIALAPDRRYSGDRVVDYVSAMEGLLLGEDEKEEIRHKFGERAGLLLAQGKRAREIAKAARELYDVRSKVVHGGIVPDAFGFGTIFQEPKGIRRRRRRRQPYSGDSAKNAREMATAILTEMVRRNGSAPDWDALIFRD